MFDLINKIWINIITSGTSNLDQRNALRIDEKFAETRRLIFLNSLTILTTILGTSLAIVSYYTGDLTQLLQRVTIVFGSIVAIILVRIQKSTFYAVIFVHIFFGIYFTVLAITSTFTLTTLIGFFVFSYISFFIWRRRYSVVWNIVMIIVVVSAVTLIRSGTFNLTYNFQSPVELLLILFFLLAVNYIQRALEDRNEDMLIDSRRELANSFSNMIAEIEKSKSLERKLQRLLGESSENNKKLEKTQKAMLNVLEDLEVEKEQIAKKQANDEAILSSIGDGLVVTNRQGKIKLVNKAFEKLMQFTSNDVVSKNFFDAIAFYDEKENLLSREESALFQALQTGEIKTNALRYFKTKTDHLIPVSISVSPVISNDQIIGAVAVIRDITKEREIDKAKTEFVSLASHQLKTPLAAINWYAEILLSGDGGKITKNQKEYIEEIYNGGRRMTDLVTALLNVSRIDMGTFAVEPELLDITEVASSVVNELKPQITLKNINIRKNYAPNVPKINADPKLIRIVLQNLISNSVKYTPDNGEVGIEVNFDEKNMKIVVSDTGYGIPKAQQSKIFSKLFRADNVVDKVTDGTGLGLYIVKSIIEEAKGKIWFESIEGKGTKFFVELPLTGMKKRTGSRQLS